MRINTTTMFHKNQKNKQELIHVQLSEVISQKIPYTNLDKSSLKKDRKFVDKVVTQKVYIY